MVSFAAIPHGLLAVIPSLAMPRLIRTTAPYIGDTVLDKRWGALVKASGSNVKINDFVGFIREIGTHSVGSLRVCEA
jgi:hypothetical protein